MLLDVGVCEHVRPECECAHTFACVCVKHASPWVSPPARRRTFSVHGPEAASQLLLPRLTAGSLLAAEGARTAARPQTHLHKLWVALWTQAGGWPCECACACARAFIHVATGPHVLGKLLCELSLQSGNFREGTPLVLL